MKIPKNARVLSVCNSGEMRSQALAKILGEYRYTNVSTSGVSLMLTEGGQELEKLINADYVIALEKRVEDTLNSICLLNDIQYTAKLITLDVKSTYSGFENDIRKQIMPYLQIDP